MAYIALDFDGTVVSHEFPNIGHDIGAVPVLKELVEKGHKLVLCTMRGTKGERNVLEEAANWFKSNGITLYGINNNPSQFRWTNSRKIFADLYIDDQALGAPTKYDPSISAKPFIDWDKVKNLLINRKYL